ncbi:MAG TPA: glycosyltransferase family 39 protein [Chloroflexota bacterium]|nr:glycosyltransferase family 39 protein [Chloroflexota bacterium]
MILALAAALRFWRLDEYLTFLGDQGRDALQVKHILTDRVLPLVGPPTTVGGLKFSPAYYYLLAVPMALFWLNPVAAAGMVAAIATAGVGLVYYLARCCFGRGAAVACALVYAVSAIGIVSARTAWNPNLLPFFALLTACALFRAHRDSNPRWYLPAALSLAVALHLHYAAVLALPPAAVAWVRDVRRGAGRRGHPARREFIRWSAVSVVVFLALILPLLAYLARSNASPDAVTGAPTLDLAQRALADAPGRALAIYAQILVGKHLAAEYSVLTVVAAVCLPVPLLWLRRELPGSHAAWALTLLTTWLVAGVFGFAAIPIALQDHYLAALAPAAYLLFGAFVAWAWRAGPPGRIGAVSLTAALILAHVSRSPLLESPDRDLAHADAVARFVQEHAGQRPYHFLVVSDRSNEATYAFHLSLYGDEPADASQDLPRQVFVVCELLECRPMRAAQAALPSFATARIDLQGEVQRAHVYRLVR